MTSLIRALSSSIGKKLLMGITGLALCGFLVVHLAGNLLLYVGAGAYNDYAHKLHSMTMLLPIAEAGLFALLLLHIALGLITARENAAARKVVYNSTKSKVVDPVSKGVPNLASKLMVPTGLVVLLFLIVHLGHFKFEFIAVDEDSSKAAQAGRILGTTLAQGVYLVGTLVLGFHLLHGFQSAFQSLGINHPKYNKAIKVIGYIFATTIALGFASFPLMGMIGGFQKLEGAPPAVEAAEHPGSPDEANEPAETAEPTEPADKH